MQNLHMNAGPSEESPADRRRPKLDRGVRGTHAALLLRSLEVYETHRIDFAEAYLVASAEAAGINDIISFDRSIDRVTTANRIEP